MYDGGIVSFYKKTNTAAAGHIPIIAYTKVWETCYENRSVGFNRYAAAKQYDTEIVYVVRTLQSFKVGTDMVALLHPYSHVDENAYQVYQVQQMTGEDGLPCTDFSLQKSAALSALDVEEG